MATTGFGQLISSFTRTQVAAVFATAILSIVPAVNFSGLFAPVSSLSGGAKILGLTFPSAWYQPVTVGVFAKALGMPDLWRNIAAIAIIALAYLILSLVLLRSRRPDVSLPGAEPVAKLAKARTLTLRDHNSNILRLVVKELKHRLDPTTPFLVGHALGFQSHGRDWSRTEATNLSVAIVDEDGSILAGDRRRTCSTNIPTRRAHQGVRDRQKKVKQKRNAVLLLFILLFFQANILAQNARPKFKSTSTSSPCLRPATAPVISGPPYSMKCKISSPNAACR